MEFLRPFLQRAKTYSNVVDKQPTDTNLCSEDVTNKEPDETINEPSQQQLNDTGSTPRCTSRKRKVEYTSSVQQVLTYT